MSARGRPVNIGASNHWSLSLPAAARSGAAHNVITVSRVTCYITALSPCDITSPYLRVTERVWSDKSLSLSATQSHYHALTVKLKTTILLRLIVSTHTRSWPLGDTLCAHDIKLSGPKQWNRNYRNRFTGFQDAISNGNVVLSGSNRHHQKLSLIY